MQTNWYKIANSAKHSYSWVYIDLPEDVVKKLVAFGKQIDPEDLFEEEGDNGLELDPHITVKYGLLTEDNKDVKKCLEGSKGGKVHMGKSSLFEGKSYDVVKISVESEALNVLHDKLNRLPHEDKHMDYCPHATIAYVKSGMGKKYDGKFDLNANFSFKEAYFDNRSKDFTHKFSSNCFNLLRSK